eukprot:scaffold1374_cov133-Skeletonema_dohrnii-CCMP3373.AAC.1
MDKNTLVLSAATISLIVDLVPLNNSQSCHFVLLLYLVPQQVPPRSKSSCYSVATTCELGNETYDPSFKYLSFDPPTPPPPSTFRGQARIEIHYVLSGKNSQLNK